MWPRAFKSAADRVLPGFDMEGRRTEPRGVANDPQRFEAELDLARGDRRRRKRRAD
jgi:hypothetical protein